VFFEPGNPSALANAILEADATPELLNGVDWHLAQHYARCIAGKHLKILEETIAEQRGSRIPKGASTARRVKRT
jgi:hypothetical protein